MRQTQVFRDAGIDGMKVHTNASCRTRAGEGSNRHSSGMCSNLEAICGNHEALKFLTKELGQVDGSKNAPIVFREHHTVLPTIQNN